MLELKNLYKSDPDERLEKMKKQYEQIKLKNEMERQKFVQQKREQQFQMNTDDIRCIESKIGEVKSQINREIQMAEKSQ